MQEKAPYAELVEQKKAEYKRELEAYNKRLAVVPRFVFL